MPDIEFPAKTVLFAAPFPDCVDDAKAFCAKYGYTKKDVRIYKATDEIKNGKEVFKVEIIKVATIRPLAINCGVINRQPPNEGE